MTRVVPWVLGALALGYLGFIHEPGYVAELRVDCAKRGEKVEKRRNAIPIDFLPYPFANYHWACSGDPQPLYRR
jgi:hypothetical protein